MTSIWLDGVQPPRDDPWLPAAPEVVVVGAGLTGLATAALLARGGLSVAVLEARTVGAVTTGNTTAKVSLLQGTGYTHLSRHHPAEVVRAYVDANREGQAWLQRYCADHDLPWQVRDTFTYAASPSEVSTVEQELEASARAGLDVEWIESADVPFPFHGGVRLADQGQIDPMPVLHALVDDLRRHGGTLHQNVRVASIPGRGRPVLHLEDGRRLETDRVVLATGMPILDRALHFARLEPERSYGLAYEGATPPTGMYLSAGSSSRSIRDLPRPDGSSALLVGGAGHPVGRAGSHAAHVDELRSWTDEHFAGARETHVWSAQDYTSHDFLPVVGPLPNSGGRIFVASGYRKWGMTNAIAAAHALSSTMLGGRNDWADVLASRSTTPSDVGRLASINVKVGAAMVAGYAAAEATSVTAPASGEGRVGRRGLNPVPVGRSNVDGRECAVAAVCTHLGGALRWNDQERSWDCPLHGSRFAPDGEVLEGPATRALRPATTED